MPQRVNFNHDRDSELTTDRADNKFEAEMCLEQRAGTMYVMKFVLDPGAIKLDSIEYGKM